MATSEGQSCESPTPEADEAFGALLDCEACSVTFAGWSPREWTIEACERHHSLLRREVGVDD